MAALLREAWPTMVVSPASWRHRAETTPGRTRPQGWAAVDDGRVVGWAFAMLSLFSNDSAIGTMGVTVHRSHRRRGLGSQLYALVLEHAATIGAGSLLASFYENDDGVAFATARGFREVRAETAAVLDPRAVSQRPEAELDIRPVREVDPVLVYTADLAATRDMPMTEPIEDMPYDEWRRHVLDHPLFTLDGSFVVLVDGVAAALSLLIADPESGRAVNMFTGTRPPYRGRGLGVAVKLASIAWAAANGITSIATTNDETNAPMLAINRRLGYVPEGRRVEYEKMLGS